MTWAPSPPVCGVRKAWLVLGGLTVQLENPAGGWFCSSLDLGYPTVREVTNSKPDQDGVDDRTMYFGARTVSVDITALTGAGARIDAVAAQFAPFMVPSARPVLHYVLDRPGAAERTVMLRAAGYSWPIVGADQRDIQLQFVASDPAAIDPLERSATSYAGASSGPGRVYNLTFNRIYPTGGGSATEALVRTVGDLAIRPKLRIYGPITQARVTLQPSGVVAIQVAFLPTFSINAGHYVEVSTAEHTAFLDGDPSQSVLAALDWYRSVWGVVPPNVAHFLTLAGSSTTGSTQVQATWHDRYLT